MELKISGALLKEERGKFNSCKSQVFCDTLEGVWGEDTIIVMIKSYKTFRSSSLKTILVKSPFLLGDYNLCQN